jgi:hypothetical protein
VDASEPPAPRRRAVRPTELPRQRRNGSSLESVEPVDLTEALEVHVPDHYRAVPEIPAPRRGR